MSEEYSKNYELIDENTAWNGNDVIPPDDIPEDAESVDTVDAMLKRQKLEKVNSRIDSIKKEIGRIAYQLRQIREAMDQNDDHNNYWPDTNLSSEIDTLEQERTVRQNELNELEQTREDIEGYYDGQN